MVVVCVCVCVVCVLCCVVLCCVVLGCVVCVCVVFILFVSLAHNYCYVDTVTNYFNILTNYFNTITCMYFLRAVGTERQDIFASRQIYYVCSDSNYADISSNYVLLTLLSCWTYIEFFQN